MLFSQIITSAECLSGGLSGVMGLLSVSQTGLHRMADACVSAGMLGQIMPWNLLADAEPAPDVNPVVQFLPMILIGLFFYFILMRPQQKEARRRKELLANLKKNDKVVTAGGMIGTIVDISGDGSRVTLKVDDNTRIKFLRSSITGPLEEKPE